MYENAKSARVDATVRQPIEGTGSPIRDRITQAEETLSAIHEMIDVLEKRLDTCLSPVPPQAPQTENGTAPIPIQSHILGRLRIMNEGYESAGRRIQRLATRVEL